MGEIAEMMEEGILCQECGEFIDEEDQVGTWTTCAGCKAEEKED